MSELPTGPQPPFFEKLFNLMMAAGVDRKPENTSFGDVVQQVYPVYRQVGLCAPQHSDHSVFNLKTPLIFGYVSQGDVVSITFIAGNPRHSGDIVRIEKCFCVRLVLQVNILFNIHVFLFLFFFFREIKHLLQWRYMTIGQTPGILSTLMHLGRPGR